MFNAQEAFPSHEIQTLNYKKNGVNVRGREDIYLVHFFMYVAFISCKMFTNYFLFSRRSVPIVPLMMLGGTWWACLMNICSVRSRLIWGREGKDSTPKWDSVTQSGDLEAESKQWQVDGTRSCSSSQCCQLTFPPPSPPGSLYPPPLDARNLAPRGTVSPIYSPSAHPSVLSALLPINLSPHLIPYRMRIMLRYMTRAVSLITD